MLLRILALSLLLATATTAAPPSVTTLYPAGGQRGTTVAITATGTFDSWPVQVWCRTPFITVKAEKTKGQFSVVIDAKAQPGVAWLRFHDASGASTLRPFVIGGLSEILETEPNDEARNSPAVALPVVVNGILFRSGDVDCFTVKLKKGETLVASLEAHETLRSPIDAVLQVLSANGEVLQQNHDTRGLDPQVTYTASQDGNYVVRLFAFPSQPDSSIRYFGSPACVYRLTLTAGEHLDFVTPLAIERNQEAKLTLHGWNLKSTTAKLDKTQDTLGLSHPVAILREPHPCLDLISQPDQPLIPPFTATGQVQKAGTPSVLQVKTRANEPLTIRLDSVKLGLSLNPVLKVSDPAGKRLLRAEPGEMGATLETAFTPATAGTYRLEIEDLFRSAGARHVYRIQVVPTVPEVTAKVASDHFTLSVGQPLDIPITINRIGGLSAELIPYAESLPEGVIAEVTQPAKPDPKIILLRLNAKKPGVSGPIRIGVQRKDDKSFQRPALATLTDLDHSTADLWLTVTPPAKK